jgi:hypothetical protein
MKSTDSDAAYWRGILQAANGIDLYNRSVSLAMRHIDASDLDAVADVKAEAFLACVECVARYDLRQEANKVRAAQYVLSHVAAWFRIQSACDDTVDGPDGPCELVHLSLEAWNNLSDANVQRVL